MRIFEDVQNRLLGCEAEQLIEQHPQGALGALLDGQIDGGVALVARQRQQRRQQRGALGDIVNTLTQQRFQFLEQHLRTVGRVKASGMLEVSDDRVERDIGMRGRALEAQPHILRFGQALLKLPYDARLADPGFARQQDRLAFTGGGALEAFEQQGEFVLAADEPGEPRAARLEAAFDRPLGENLPSTHRFGDALELLRAEIVENEGGADQLPGQLGDDDLTGPCELFEPCGKVRGLAGDGAGLSAGCAVKVTDDDSAGSDADMHSQRQFVRRDDRRQTSAHRLGRVVLAGLRPPEIGEDAIAEIIGDIAAEAAHDRGDSGVIAAQQLPQILGVVPARQFGRADEVAEQHTQLPAFRLARRTVGSDAVVSCGRGGRHHGKRLRARHLGDRAQQAPTMTQRQAQLLQVVVAKLRQQVEIDVVGRQRVGEFFQTYGVEPAAQIFSSRHSAVLGYPRRGYALRSTPKDHLGHNLLSKLRRNPVNANVISPQPRAFDYDILRILPMIF